MPSLYNIDVEPQVVHRNLPAVQPGDSFDFSDEQIAAGIGGRWSAERGGPEAADVKKAAAKGRRAANKTTEPAAPEKEKEE